MRRKLRQVDRCPGRLSPGEYKRVPPTGPIIGVYLACPVCGYRCITIVRAEHVVDDTDGLLTVKEPVECLVCAKLAQITRGEFIVDGV